MCVSCLHHLLLHTQLPKPNDREERGQLHYATAASMTRMPHKMSFPEWWFILCVQARKKPVGALWHADRLPLDGKSKICSLVANAGGKNKTTKRIQTTKRIPDHHSHLLLSEYQAWWPTSLSGPLPKRPPIPHSWQHRTRKHRPGILLMLGRHKVTMRAAVLKYDTTFQRGEL